LTTYADEIARGERFPFGNNWRRFLERFDERMLEGAVDSLRQILGVSTLAGRRFLDAGCGSGVFSLAATRLGAAVHAFDYDAESVSCALELRRRHGADGCDWVIEQGSVLDKDYLSSLGYFDVVYSWGVLHHTGAMWNAIENVSAAVLPRGQLCLALYNDAGAASRRWAHLKALYNRVPAVRPLLILFGLLRLRSGLLVRGFLSGHPLRVWRSYGNERRSMSAWYDLIDWLGGYPYEYASREGVEQFLGGLGFRLDRLTSVGNGLGCNEFLFERVDSSGP
jgi:2-polyprenyl-6-hydroxyphenyl methylase/3-demethylubiquinone-9 3-methyltransferase